MKTLQESILDDEENIDVIKDNEVSRIIVERDLLRVLNKNGFRPVLSKLPGTEIEVDDPHHKYVYITNMMASSSIRLAISDIGNRLSRYVAKDRMLKGKLDNIETTSNRRGISVVYKYDGYPVETSEDFDVLLSITINGSYLNATSQLELHLANRIDSYK